MSVYKKKLHNEKNHTAVFVEHCFMDSISLSFLIYKSWICSQVSFSILCCIQHDSSPQGTRLGVSHTVLKNKETTHETPSLSPGHVVIDFHRNVCMRWWTCMTDTIPQQLHNYCLVHAVHANSCSWTTQGHRPPPHSSTVRLNKCTSVGPISVLKWRATFPDIQWVDLMNFLFLL